jgi:hypothetical protein
VRNNLHRRASPQFCTWFPVSAYQQARSGPPLKIGESNEVLETCCDLVEEAETPKNILFSRLQYLVVVVAEMVQEGQDRVLADLALICSYVRLD